MSKASAERKGLLAFQRTRIVCDVSMRFAVFCLSVGHVGVATANADVYYHTAGFECCKYYYI